MPHSEGISSSKELRVVQYTQLESIRLTGSRFENLVSLLSFCDTGSRFPRDLGVGRNVVDSIRFGRIVTNRPPCCRFVIPEVDLWRLKICSATGVLGSLENVVDW